MKSIHDHFSARFRALVRAGQRLVIALGLLGGAAAGWAFVGTKDSEGHQQHWDLVTLNPRVATNVFNPVTRAVRFHLGSEGYSVTNRTAELNALRASFAQWQAVPGTRLKFEEGGLAPANIDVNLADGSNVVFWAHTRLVNGGLNDVSGRLGTTFSSFTDDGTMLEADIALNGVDYAWFTDFSDTANNNQCVEAVALHEMGHMFGLGHAVVGGATLLFRGRRGISAQIGLSSDEIVAMRALYPQPSLPATLGSLKGRVTMNDNAVFGAVVAVEDAAGNLVAGTVTGANGEYELPALSPGSYQARTAPLDPYTSNRLVSGADIAGFAGAEVNFLPSTNYPVTLSVGQTNVMDFAVAAGAPPFRITWIRTVTDSPFSGYSISALPVLVSPGRSNLTMGVFSADLPTSDATLTLSGDGVTVGPTDFQPNTSFNNGALILNGLTATLSIASNAAPGLRSFIVTRTSDNAKAYAQGFLEILSQVIDYNFDGLDDRFQRQYFPLFTAPEAGPDADPDHDGYSNRAENVAGTNPTNAASLLRLESATTAANGTTIRWQSGAGRRYQVAARPALGSGSWQNLGAPVTATNALAEFLDAGATNRMNFYRVQALP